MDRRQIIMNYGTPPSIEDLEVIASAVIDTMPAEITSFCDSIVIQVEEMPDEALEIEMDLDDPYDLIVLYRSGKELSPGVESKVANDDDILIVYRRPFLDYWCEEGQDIAELLRQIIIEELGDNFDFDEDEIEEMVKSSHQGFA